MFFFWWILLWFGEYMSFCNSAVVVSSPMAIINDNSLWHLDYDFVESVSTYQLLDNISPILVYDMEKYIDQNFINSHPYFRWNYSGFSYGSYLTAYVIEYGTLKGINEWEAHLLFYSSSVKKIYLYNMTFLNYDDIDFYIMDWGMDNIIYAEHERIIQEIIDDPDVVRCYSFNPEVLVTLDLSQYLN